MDIQTVLRTHQRDLMNKLGVVGVGIGINRNKPCIMIYVENMDDGRQLPKELDGFETYIIETGGVEAAT